MRLDRLGKLVRASAALATVDQLDPLANQEKMATMVLTVSRASQAIAVPQLDQRPKFWAKDRTNVLAKLHQETLDQLDRKDPTDNPVMLEPQALMANPEIREHADHPAHPELVEIQETKDHLETMANSLLHDPAHPAHLDNQESPVQADPLVNQANLAKTEIKDNQANLEMLALEAHQANLEMVVLLAKLAKSVRLVVASTAHQLVWLQVIKRRHSTHSDHTGHCEMADLDTSSHWIFQSSSPQSLVSFFFVIMLEF